MSDLAERLKGTIEEHLAEARKQLRWAQDTILMLSDPKWLGRSVPGWHEWPAIEAVLTLAIRQHEAALRVLERHRPRQHDEWLRVHFGANHWCGACRGNDVVPCIEVRELADAYGVPVDTEEENRG